MMNNAMTGPIFISLEDSNEFLNNIMNPTDEYLRDREEYFDKLASSMKMRSEGTETIVEFADLDLSDLDGLLEADRQSLNRDILDRDSEYISNSMNIVFVGVQERKDSLLNTMFIDCSFDVTNTLYSCDQKGLSMENLVFNLAEAA